MSMQYIHMEDTKYRMAVLTGLEQNWCLFVPYEFVCGCCCWRIGELLQVCLLFSPANGKGEKLMTCSVFEAELQDVIPICHATIAGTRIIGRLIVGYASLPFLTQKRERKRKEKANKYK